MDEYPDDGDPEKEVDLFLAHLATGEPAAQYAQRFGHFGPTEHVCLNCDPLPQTPAPLLPIDDELSGSIRGEDD